MSHLDQRMLHVRFLKGTEKGRFSLPRRYTLTHSDRTGHMYLTVGADYCQEEVSGLYTRFMRDEVLAEWMEREDGYELHIHCHVSGGLVFGTPGMRMAIFRMHMPAVLEALRQGDDGIYQDRPELERSMAVVHFCSHIPKYNGEERYGPLSEHR